MNMHDLRALRPAERTSHAVISALSRIKARAAIVAERVGEMLAARPQKLLAADVHQVEALERDLAAARVEAEQLAALEAAVTAELPAVRAAETRSALTKKIEHLAARVPALRRAVLEEYPVLAARIADICRQERAFHDQAHAVRSAVRAAGDAGAGVPLDVLTIGYVRSAGAGAALCHDVRLPGVAPSGPAVLGLQPPTPIFGGNENVSADVAMATAAGRAYGPQGPASSGAHPATRGRRL